MLVFYSLYLYFFGIIITFNFYFYFLLKTLNLTPTTPTWFWLILCKIPTSLNMHIIFIYNPIINRLLRISCIQNNIIFLKIQLVILCIGIEEILRFKCISIKTKIVIGLFLQHLPGYFYIFLLFHSDWTKTGYFLVGAAALGFSCVTALLVFAEDFLVGFVEVLHIFLLIRTELPLLSILIYISFYLIRLYPC